LSDKANTFIVFASISDLTPHGRGHVQDHGQDTVGHRVTVVNVTVERVDITLRRQIQVLVVRHYRHGLDHEEDETAGEDNVILLIL